jgi:hypothetical protein
MSYRGDLDAAHARIIELEQELEDHKVWCCECLRRRREHARSKIRRFWRWLFRCPYRPDGIVEYSMRCSRQSLRRARCPEIMRSWQDQKGGSRGAL